MEYKVGDEFIRNKYDPALHDMTNLCIEELVNTTVKVFEVLQDGCLFFCYVTYATLSVYYDKVNGIQSR